uniref:Uncharacterized protein n=1 Tax=viral metagenome TaxID=1070528 RepID=A0A6M3K3A0_9ZZZZ
MEEITRVRLLGDWKRIEDSNFWAEFVKLLKEEDLNIDKALRADSNSHEKDMFLKGQLFELKRVHDRLAKLVHNIGGEVG